MRVKTKTKTITKPGAWAWAYYKSNRRGGVGREFYFDPGERERFVPWLEGTLRAYRDTAPEILFEQLDAIGAQGKGELTELDGWTLFANIYWLERRGHLKPDKFNGVVWCKTLSRDRTALEKRAARAVPPTFKKERKR